jgi:hypothetical protein
MHGGLLVVANTSVTLCVCGGLGACREGWKGGGWLFVCCICAGESSPPMKPVQQESVEQYPPRWFGAPLAHARPTCCAAQMR